MPGYTIDHDRPTCIGCAACEAVAPDFWEMAEDGKSDVKGAERVMSGNDIVREKLDIKKEDFRINMDAAESCPVNCIHLLDEKGKKLI